MGAAGLCAAGAGAVAPALPSWQASPVGILSHEPCSCPAPHPVPSQAEVAHASSAAGTPVEQAEAEYAVQRARYHYLLLCISSLVWSFQVLQAAAELCAPALAAAVEIALLLIETFVASWLLVRLFSDVLIARQRALALRAAASRG